MRMIDTLPGVRGDKTFVVVGSGPSLKAMPSIPAGSVVIACNRAIEIVAADYLSYSPKLLPLVELKV